MSGQLTQAGSTKPSLAELLIEAINARIAELHTGLPAQVVAFDEDAQTCDVQPLLLHAIVGEDGARDTERYPQISNVPIHYPSAGGWSLIFPLKPDDIVFLTFAERSIDRWLESSGDREIDPEHSRKHDLSDAVCIPGIRPRRKPIEALATLGDDCRLGWNDGDPAIVLKPDGTIEIGEGATESLLLGETLIGLLTGHTHTFVGVGAGLPGETLPTLTNFDAAKSEKGKVK